MQQSRLRQRASKDELMTVVALLGAAGQRGDLMAQRKALEMLCSLWHARPVSALGAAIERLAGHVESDAARALRAHDGLCADEALWRQVYHERAPWDLSALVETAMVCELDVAVARARLLTELVEQRGRVCSPCLSGPVMRWLQRPTFTAPASRPIFEAALEILASAGDPRALDLVRRLENANVSLGKPMAAWLDARLDGLRAQLLDDGLERWLGLEATLEIAEPLAALERIIEALEAPGTTPQGASGDLVGAPIEPPLSAADLGGVELSAESFALPAVQSALLAASPGGERLALLVRPVLVDELTDAWADDAAVHIVDREGSTLAIAPTPDWRAPRPGGEPGPAAMSRDGHTLSSAIDAGVAWLEVDSGRRGVLSLEAAPGAATRPLEVTALDVAPDGRFTAVLAVPRALDLDDPGCTLRELDRESGGTLRRHELGRRRRPHGISVVRYSPSGRWLACICDELLLVIDRDRDARHQVESPSGTWYDLTWLAEPERIAAVDHNGRVQVFAPDSPTPLTTLDRPASPEPPRAFTRIGAPIGVFADATTGLTTVQPHHAAYGDTSRVADVRVHSATDVGGGFGPARTLELAHQGVEALASPGAAMTWDSQRDELVVVDAERGRLCWWNPGAAASPSHVIERFAHRVRGLSSCVDADGVEVVAGWYGARLCLWRDAVLVDTLDAPGAILSAALMSEGRTLVVAMRRGLRLWNLAPHAGAARALHGLTGVTCAVAASPEGRHVAAGSDDGSVCVWRVEDGALVDERGATGTAIAAVAFHPRGHLLAAIDVEGEIHIWEPATPTRCAHLHRPIRDAHGLAWSRDGQRLVVANAHRLAWLDPRATEAGVDDQEVALEVPTTSLVAHPSADAFVLGDEDGCVWRVEPGRSPTRVARAHLASVSALGFGRDDTLLVGAAHQGRYASIVRWVSAPISAA